MALSISEARIQKEKDLPDKARFYSDLQEEYEAFRLVFIDSIHRWITAFCS